MVRLAIELGQGSRKPGPLAAGVMAFGLAVLFAVPGFAQSANTTQPPAPTLRPCTDRDIAAGVKDCASPNGASGVTLPDILVDLFPFIDGVTPGTGDFTVDQGGNQTGTPPVPTPDPRDPSDGREPAVENADAAPPSGGGTPTPPQPPVPPGSVPPPLVPPVAVSGEFVPDEVLVTVEGDAAAVQDLAAAFGLEVRSQRTSTLLNSSVARLGIPDGRPVGVVLAQLAADGRTQSRVPNHVYDLQQAAGTVNYAFQRIALDSGEASGADVRVAVIDTAIDETHPALAGAIADIFDAMPDRPIVGRDHGTSVAGLIGGDGPFRGMAPGSIIYHARAFESGKSTMDIILSALDWSAEQDVRIVNMSFVGPKNALMEAACASARGRGIILVAAAGNNGPGAPWGYPAAYKGVIAVTATDEQDGLMQQANRGPYVFVSAPGVDMLAPIGGGSDLVTGTSFAAAIVSGAIANLLHENPGRSAKWIEKALAETAVDLGKKGRDSDFGYGLINTRAAGAVAQ